MCLHKIFRFYNYSMRCDKHKIKKSKDKSVVSLQKKKINEKSSQMREHRGALIRLNKIEWRAHSKSIFKNKMK